ncbi:transposase [Streptomyces sp. RKAG290]|uniref:transposase n=1 Tax=Streptomyces sp. RKAG290 TaxID=2888348 RepID=UPI0035A8D333
MRNKGPLPLMLDTRGTGSWGSEDGHLVVVKNHSPEFKAAAVALYESRSGAAIRSVAVDLGINPRRRGGWSGQVKVSRSRGRRAHEPAQPPNSLEAQNATLRTEVRELVAGDGGIDAVPAESTMQRRSDKCRLE